MAKRMKTWIYHGTEEPQVVFEDEAEEYHAHGWADTPAKFLKVPNPGDVLGARELEVAIDGVKDQLNGALNLENMTKAELIRYGRKHFNAQLSKRESKVTLVMELKGLIGLKGVE